LSILYSEWLQRDPVFIPKQFRPTPTKPQNPDVDKIRHDQARSNVTSELEILKLNAKSAQNKIGIIDSEILSTINNLTTDETVKDKIKKVWNDQKMRGETFQLKKWEDKFAWHKKLPDQPEIVPPKKPKAPANKPEGTNSKNAPKKSTSNLGNNKKVITGKPGPVKRVLTPSAPFPTGDKRASRGNSKVRQNIDRTNKPAPSTVQDTTSTSRSKFAQPTVTMGNQRQQNQVFRKPQPQWKKK
jgi:hypothetical protein